jgi:hypothetical protein
MPTPGGLPKRGEIWTRTTRLPPDWKPNVITFVVIERGKGFYWSLRVHIPRIPMTQLWVDASYWLKQGELKYVGPAGPETRKKLGLLCP